MYRKILLATDGSPTSKAALREAVKLAHDGANIRAVTVVLSPTVTFPSPYGMAYDVGLLRNAAIEGGRAALEATVQQLKEKGVEAEGSLIDLTETPSTDIAAALQEEAKDWGADLLVIGTHGRTGVKRFFLGSVAEQIIRSSCTPVLLVRCKGEGDECKDFSEWDEKVMGD